MKRLQIGLRLMLLIVALFAVIFAWIGARRDLQRANVRGELQRLEIFRKFAVKKIDDPQDGNLWRSSVTELDEEIAKRRRQLGESAR